MIGLLTKAALSCKHDPYFVNVIIYHQYAVLIKAMKYAFFYFLYLQILQLWILIMLKLSLTLINMKSGATVTTNNVITANNVITSRSCYNIYQ